MKHTVNFNSGKQASYSFHDKTDQVYICSSFEGDISSQEFIQPTVMYTMITLVSPLSYHSQLFSPVMAALVAEHSQEEWTCLHEKCGARNNGN